MPLITVAVMAYAAGLLAGFAHLLLPAACVAIVTLLATPLVRDARAAACACVFAAGALFAWAAQGVDQRCRDILSAARTWDATLDDAAAPGAFVPASVRVGRCTAHASIAVERGVAAAGSAVRVRGAGAPTARGIRIQHAALARAPGGSRLVRWRDAAGRRIDLVFRHDAPLVRALVIADTRSLDPALRDRFAAAGIVHMLAISGLHVAIIATMLEVMFVAIRLPRSAALFATLVATALYIAIIGAPPAAVRSGAMLGVGIVSRLAQRPTSPWASLAIGAAVPLVNPHTVLDVGWQLSVIGIASLVASGRLARRVVAPRWDGWRAQLATGLLASTVACTVTAPLVAWTFGQVSLIAPLSNLVASPLIAVLQPTLFLATLCSPVPAVGRYLADAAHPMLAAFDGIATTAANVPHATLVVAPTAVGAACAGLACFALLVACVSHFPVRPLIAGIAAAAASLWAPLATTSPHVLELHLIDVGQGDAVALRTPEGHWVVIDAGRAWRGGDAGHSTVIPYLRRRGGDVALFILTHPHADHAGGAASVLRALHPRRYWDGAYVGTSETYRTSLDAARAAGVAWHRTRPGDSLVIDGVHVTVLAPDSAWMAGLDAPNEASVVVLVRYGAVRALLMGDAERGEEGWILAHRDSLRVDVLKVGHHGSNTSSSEPFLDAVKPRLALVSVGTGNSYGHPSASVMTALADHHALVLRTDREGTIVVRTDGSHITVTAGGDEWPLASGP